MTVHDRPAQPSSNVAIGGVLVTLEITMICCRRCVAPSLSVTYNVAVNNRRRYIGDWANQRTPRNHRQSTSHRSRTRHRDHKPEPIEAALRAGARIGEYATGGLFATTSMLAVPVLVTPAVVVTVTVTVYFPIAANAWLGLRTRTGRPIAKVPRVVADRGAVRTHDPDASNTNTVHRIWGTPARQTVDVTRPTSDCSRTTDRCIRAIGVRM